MRQELNINRASVCELELVFHSRERAQLVVNKRELLGNFKTWDDLKERLPGVSDRLVEQLRAAGLTVGPEN